MAEFHFLRPAWLILLPVVTFFAWRLLTGRGAGSSWQKIVDSALQPFVLAAPEALKERRLPTLLGIAASILVTIALAGPAWDRLPVPVYRSDEALVVALDLSRSMDAGDVEPSRLARAKIKLLSLLERRPNGQTALVVFSAHAFTVTPLTTDTATVAALIGALATDIMPSQGSYPEAGLTKAGSLLEQAGMTAGQILLVTDADVSPQSLDVTGDLRRQGYSTNVLAVGTADGAPIPRREGGFMTSASGQVVVPQLNADGLRRLARAGGGRFAQLTPDDRDLDALFPGETVGTLEAATEEGDDFEADIWRDQGIWLTLVLLPIVALGFRRGWIYLFVVAFALPGQQARAFGWRDLWQSADQQGREALAADEPARAAELFEDPEWRAAASYQAGNFAASAQTLAGIGSPDALYNRGNALAKSGELSAALDAYERTLELDPGDEDAIYNRDLVRDLLEQQEQQQEQQDQQSDPSEANQQQSQASNEDGEQSDESQSQQSDQTEDQSSDDGEQQQAQDQQSSSDSDSREEQQAENEPEQTEAEDAELPMQAATLPEDIEEWASEQAADQWLRRIPQDPGGLLRRKFLYQYQRLGVDQEGNYVWPGDEAEPW